MTNREDRDRLCWFHGKLNREIAEELIKQEAQEDGWFLVRESSTAPGDFVLTLYNQGEVCHYQIRRHGEDAFFSIDDKVKIVHGLETLIEFYRQASNGLETKLTNFVKKDPPPNDSRSHGVNNLLHRATRENNHTVVSELLKCGYRNLDAKNEQGHTAVHIASLYGDETMLQLLINAKVNVNCMDTSGNMPLHYACRQKSASFIQILIDAHANVQGRNIQNGFVPLHEAAKNGNLDAVKLLLNANAPLLPRTSFGEFPIDLAKEANQQEVVTFLNNYKTPPAKTYENQWYHGTLKREEASELLLSFAESLEKTHIEMEGNAKLEGEEADDAEEKAHINLQLQTLENVDTTSGCFLVRYSERKTNCSGYVLTLLFDKQVKNFIISKAVQTNYLYIDDGPYLPSLEHLVEHFMRFSDGLPISLKYPVLPKPKPPLPLFSTMPRSHHRKSSDNIVLPTSSPDTTKKIPIKIDTLIQQLPLSPKQKQLTSQTLLNPKKKQKENSHSQIFNTFRLKSPKKSGGIIDSMTSLRKKKKKSTSISEGEQQRIKNNKIEADELKKAEPLLKTLSFSTDFSKLQLNDIGDDDFAADDGLSNDLLSTLSLPVTENFLATSHSKKFKQQQLQQLQQSVSMSSVTLDGFYNVPQNNTAVATADIDATTITTITTTTVDAASANTLKKMPIEMKTDEEVEYFTKSDVAIELERANEQLQACSAQQFNTNANGYIPTVDIRLFLDPTTNDFSQASLEASAAELREFSNHPERLDSLISTVSTENEIMQQLLNRQTSNISTTSETAKATTCGSTIQTAKLNYFIPPEMLELESIIGEGEFGSVYQGHLRRINNETGTEVRCAVAIKTLRDELCRSNKKEFLREASVMIRLQHHCIVQLIGISKDETLMMVQEIVPLGSMLNFILLQRNEINPNNELKLWASQIACGMEYLESHHFVHRDLAARNILVASRNQVKISDFGLSRALGTGNDYYQASQGGKWPIKWYAPESYNNGLFSHASDVWSFGVTLWEMFTLGEPPYGDIRGLEAIQLIESGQRLPKPSLCPENVYEIMKNCWNYKPKDRPTFRYLTEFFTNNYQNLMELVKTEHIS